MNTEAVRKYPAEQGIAEEEALKQGMEAKSKEFVEKGAEGSEERRAAGIPRRCDRRTGRART